MACLLDQSIEADSQRPVTVEACRQWIALQRQVQNPVTALRERISVLRRQCVCIASLCGDTSCSVYASACIVGLHKAGAAWLARRYRRDWTCSGMLGNVLR